MSSPSLLITGTINSTVALPVNSSSVNSTKVDLRDENLAVIEIGVQVSIIILAVIGNSVVMLTLKFRKKKLSRMHLMIVHLSLADLFVAFFNVLPQLAWDITYRFVGGDLLCRLVKYFQIVAMYASSYVLLTTAVDRYYAICRPLTSATWTFGKIQKLVMVAWFVSLVFSIPQVAIFSYRETAPGTGIYDCWGVFEPEWKLQLYITWITLSVYIIPTLILALAYGCICHSVWKSGKMAQTLTPRFTLQNSRVSGKSNTMDSVLSKGVLEENVQPVQMKPPVHGISRAKMKTIKLTMTVIICYLICWSPFFIAQMWAAFDPNAPFYGPIYSIILLLASLNSCTNPWIYVAFSDTVCSELKKLFVRQNRGRRDDQVQCVCVSCFRTADPRASYRLSQRCETN
ncbi:cephalotocin receptor 1-like [Haliotis rubra]|uniref:cephalotocin receptor 1-like n=1 Tax=Haliotis rubra TaxID=36100 RepID=UPI001EE6204C|nr:cephalotocin receptor 1-like [Haliotis rubra]